MNRYQFREYDDLEIESCFGYPFVDRIGYFLSLLYDGGKVNKNRDMHIGVHRLHRILGEQYFERVNDLLNEEGVIETIALREGCRCRLYILALKKHIKRVC